jgi:hypothetical protein
MDQRMPRSISPIGGGHGRPFGSPDFDVAQCDYEIAEYRVEGDAVSYEWSGGAGPDISGWWDSRAGPAAAYCVRVIVVRPTDPGRFNGVLLVNWQTVTGGADLGAPTRRDLERGYAWVGVTAQRIGVEGSPGLPDVLPRTPSLAEWDPIRYAALHHPGDAYSYDIYAQVGRLMRSTGQPDNPLTGLEPNMVIAVGTSQSAMRLGSYVNVAHRRDLVFDGFFLYLHLGVCPYLPDQELAPSLTPIGEGLYGGSSKIRDDGSVPIMVLCSEFELAQNFPVRQPDTSTFRFWQVAGAAHVDVDVFASMAAVLERDGLSAPLREPGGNEVRWQYVRDAALQRLVDWLGTSTPPPSIAPIEIDTAWPLTVRRDRHGNALGGVRLPELEAPTATHLGTRTDMTNGLAAVAGQTIPLSRDDVLRSTPDIAAYLSAWDSAVDRLAGLGLVLDEDVAMLRARGRSIATRTFG